MWESQILCSFCPFWKAVCKLKDEVLWNAFMNGSHVTSAVSCTVCVVFQKHKMVENRNVKLGKKERKKD